LLIDEYQDLNRCDLSVISAIRDRGVEIFGAGDDDQSIYGFRYAHPEGIRRFDEDHTPASSFTLGTCIRCDRKIIDLALFIANLDPYRLEKPIEPRVGAGDGEVYLLRFSDQLCEAEGVAHLCKYLIGTEGYSPKDILILMRSDRNGVFSSLLREYLDAYSVPVAIQVEGTPLDQGDGRILLSFLRLLVYNGDSLALRTLLMTRENGIGNESFSHIYSLAQNISQNFSNTAHQIIAEPELIPRIGSRISGEIQEILSIIQANKDSFEAANSSLDPRNLLIFLRDLANHVIRENSVKTDVLDYLGMILQETNATDFGTLLRALSSSLENEEQELDSDSVNIMTMHKAKGLTSEAVIVVAAEDEYIPGRQTGEKEGDERRLLYVSLSRARHFLAVTYCDYRKGLQRHTGRTSGQTRRTLTRFLRDAPIRPIDGIRFINSLD